MMIQKLIHRRFALALSCTIIVTVLGWWRLGERDRRLARSVRMTTVLKVKKFLPAGKLVSPDAVEEYAIPEAYAPPTAPKTKRDLVDATGNLRYKARAGIPKDEYLSAALLSDPSGFGGLAWTLEPGQAAFSVRLNAEDAVAGLLRPGDFVRVFSAGDKGVRVVLERVRVAAIGDRMWDPSGGEMPDSSEISKAMAGEPVVVTLMGMLSEALATRQAVVKGTVGLALLSPLTQPSEGE